MTQNDNFENDRTTQILNTFAKRGRRGERGKRKIKKLFKPFKN
jgi:hypothetical protein